MRRFSFVHVGGHYGKPSAGCVPAPLWLLEGAGGPMSGLGRGMESGASHSRALLGDFRGTLLSTLRQAVGQHFLAETVRDREKLTTVVRRLETVVSFSRSPVRDGPPMHPTLAAASSAHALFCLPHTHSMAALGLARLQTPTPPPPPPHGGQRGVSSDSSDVTLSLAGVRPQSPRRPETPRSRMPRAGRPGRRTRTNETKGSRPPG